MAVTLQTLAIPGIFISYTVKNVTDFPVPSRNVTDQTLPGREYFNHSRPGRVWSVTSRLGTGKSVTFFYSVLSPPSTGRILYVSERKIILSLFCVSFLYIFIGLQCVGHSFAYVTLSIFLRDVWIRTQRAAVESRRDNNLATHPT
jgi:hypothetical protein